MAESNVETQELFTAKFASVIDGLHTLGKKDPRKKSSANALLESLKNF